MSALAAFQKRAIEKKRYTLDYSCWLDEGELLADFAIVVTPATVPALVASGAYSDPTSTKITTYVGGGMVGVFYQVTFVATTSQGQVKRDDLQMRVY
jgi:hypothetical protein